MSDLKKKVLAVFSKISPKFCKDFDEILWTYTKEIVESNWMVPEKLKKDSRNSVLIQFYKHLKNLLFLIEKF